MVSLDDTVCPDCGGYLAGYDHVKRIIRSKYGDRKFINIPRYRCKHCYRLHRAIPSYILPYKHYEIEVINGVVEGLITSDTLGFEDYPCEITMKRWCADKPTEYVLTKRASYLRMAVERRSM